MIDDNAFIINGEHSGITNITINHHETWWCCVSSGY